MPVFMIRPRHLPPCCNAVSAGRLRAVPAAGFTLLELMAVMVVVAILIVLLISGSGVARDSVDSLKCRNNMRQVAAAVLLYSQDNDGYLPGRNYGLSAAQSFYGRARNQLATEIAPYIGLPEQMPTHILAPVFLCPTFARKYPELVQTSPQRFIWQLNITNQIADDPFSWPFGRISEGRTSLRLEQIQDTASSMIMQEADQTLITSNWAAAPEPFHRNGRHRVYFDGHVQWIETR